MRASQEVLDYTAGLTPGSHAVLFYDSEDVASSIFGAYVDAGVKRREATYFACSSRDCYERLLELAGVDFRALERGGYLTYAPIEGYRFDRDRALEGAEGLLTKARESGFKGVRILCLADLRARPVSLSVGLAYERSLGASLPIPVSFLCSYDAEELLNQGGDDAFIELLQAHGHVIFKGLASPRTEEAQTRRAIVAQA